MSGTGPGQDPVRVAKFERVLPRLHLGKPAYLRGETVTLHLASPIAELCDVCLRLRNETGRTYAQVELQLGPDTGSIALCKLLNIPEGRYEVVATPPLAQFFATTPVEHRLPCRLFSASPADSLAGRRVAALVGLAGGHGFKGALSRHVLGQDAAPSATSEIERLLRHLAGLEPEADLAGLALRALDREATGGTESRLKHQLAALGRDGFDLAPDRLQETVVTLAALAHGWRDADGRDLAMALLDKLAYCLALADASLQGPVASAARRSLAALRALLFGPSTTDQNEVPDEPALLAMALLDGWEPPPLIARIAAAPDDHARHWPAPGRPGLPHLEARHGGMRFGDAVLELREGDDGLRLDFTPPQADR
jgi:hypothetical protein